jgi:ATP-dependent Clp protease ATP-binding subunit ClpA
MREFQNQDNLKPFGHSKNHSSPMLINKQFGARPLKELFKSNVEDTLAEEILLKLALVSLKYSWILKKGSPRT